MDVPGYTPTELRNNDVVADDRPCVGCSYNLRGLRRDGACPECGGLVARSMFPSLLAAGERRHIARLRLGAALLVVAVTLGAAVGGLRWAQWLMRSIQAASVPTVTVTAEGNSPSAEVRWSDAEIVRIKLGSDLVTWTATRRFHDDSSVTTHVDSDGAVRWESSARDPDARGAAAVRVTAPPERPAPPLHARLRSALLRWTGARITEGSSATARIPRTTFFIVRAESDRTVVVRVEPEGQSVTLSPDGRAHLNASSASTPAGNGPLFGAVTTTLPLRLGRASQALQLLARITCLWGLWLLTRRDRSKERPSWPRLRWATRGAALAVLLGWLGWAMSIEILVRSRSWVSGRGSGAWWPSAFWWLGSIGVACVLTCIGIYVGRLCSAIGDRTGSRGCRWFAALAPIPILAMLISGPLVNWIAAIPPLRAWELRVAVYQWLGLCVVLAAIWLLLRFRRRLRRHAETMRAATPAPAVGAPN